MGNFSCADHSSTTLQPPLLAKLSELVERRLGLHFPPNHLDDLARKITAAAGDFGFDAVDSCVEWLLCSPFPQGVDALASHLTVGETYFFRDRRVFELLQEQILPEIIRSRRGGERYLRFWSAGCATGEEPYSLAIVLSRLLADFKQWNIKILATDISTISLKKAEAGIYGEWSFRDTPPWLKHDYFEPIDYRFKIAARIRETVTFASLNMVRDPYPAIVNSTNALDLIFCRNVLMYFSRARAGEVLHNLCRCLVDGGWLVISPIEVPGLDLPPLLRPVHFPGAILYQKTAAQKTFGPPPRIQPAGPEPEPESAVPLRTTRTLPAREPVRLPDPPEPAAADTGAEAEQVRLLANTGRLGEALALCAKAILSDKLNPSLHYLQATIQDEMGRPDEAAAAFKRAMYIDQDFLMAHFALGHLLQRQGKFREAAKHLGKAGSLLRVYGKEEIPPEAEGLNAGRLLKLLDTIGGAGTGRGVR